VDELNRQQNEQERRVSWDFDLIRRDGREIEDLQLEQIYRAFIDAVEREGLEAFGGYTHL